MKNRVVVFLILFVISFLIFLCDAKFRPVYAQTGVPGTVNGTTYTIYGGLIPNDTINPDWTAGSDNVVWDFGQKKMVYRLVKSLSLKYNPGGEFHIIRKEPIDIKSFKFLSFVGRTDDAGLDFEITFINDKNQPIGAPLKFSNFGGKLATNYWTQYNFPISSFLVPGNTVSGIKISYLSDEWYSVIFLDEIYLSDLRGEYINPAISTPTPTPSETKKKSPLDGMFVSEVNPMIFLIPVALLAIAVFFH